MQTILDLTPDVAAGAVTLRLTDAHGRQLGYHRVRLSDHPPSRWEALFDTAGYVARYAGNLVLPGRNAPASEVDLLVDLGVFIHTQILGPEIAGALAGTAQRTLLVRLPRPADPASAALIGDLARVPWELARAAPRDPPLIDCNLVLRLLLEGSLPAAGMAPLALGPGEDLRILLVFAEAPGRRPLAMRRERETLLALLRDEIQRRGRVRVDVLCHGVDCEALRRQVKEAHGYHLLHWSGHGLRNLLEIQGADGGRAHLSGEQLVALLREAGGFYPRLVYLSACHSGAMGRPRSWSELRAGTGPAANQASGSGLTDTALALLGAGVPQVVAMRWVVGDDYARRLARRFYGYLLGTAAYSADSALNQARKDLLQHPKVAQMAAVDHANPLILGAERVQMRPHPGRSAQLARRVPRPQPLLPGGRSDLDPRSDFVGRGEPLTRLNREWLAHDSKRVVALVQGLAGLGKTALAAECIALWHRRFDWVLCWQTRPDPLGADSFYRELDLKLTRDSEVYRQTCDQSSADRIYLEPGPLWSGAERYARMRTNLLQAAAAEPILFVLDNFETNLVEPEGAPPSGPAERDHPARDPEWGTLLAALAEGLPGTRSRLLVTSRHRPAALFGSGGAARCFWLPLGPLPPEDAWLYLNQCPAFAALVHGDAADQALGQRCLELSRGHPLILERLCGLAGDPAAPDRQGLTQALDTLSARGGYARLPDLFGGEGDAAQQAEQRRYLEDVGIGAIDLLLGQQGPDGRLLLWVLALAGEPVDTTMLAGVWAGTGDPDRPSAPAEVAAALLTGLHRAGLIYPESDHGPWDCHELVRERALAWMAAHPQEPAGRSAEQVLLAFGERFESLFQALLSSGAANARDRAVEAGRRAFGYCIRAGALERLHGFTSTLILNTHDPRLLDGLVQQYRSLVEQVPDGRSRWSLRAYIADGLRHAGRADESLPFYAQAAAEAESAGHWADLGWISQNWGNALRDTGDLDAAKVQFCASAEVKRAPGTPAIQVLISDFESLRIDVMQGEARAAWPGIERLLGQVRGWWQRSRADESVAEAPDPESLGRAMVGALDVARLAALRLEKWAESLALLDEKESVEKDLGFGEHARARTRFNRYGPLLRLDRLPEAQSVLESCLDVYRRCEDITRQARTFTALASLWYLKDDPGQAADLERRALDLHNRLPDPGVRGLSHNNLAKYLHSLRQTANSAPHRLAALCYALIGGYDDRLRQFIDNLSIDMAESRDQGRTYPLPTLEDLLTDPRFDPLRRFVAERGIDPAALQREIDERLAQADG